MINVNILADSINGKGSRLTTFILTYPRFIHAEFMTHRAFSRNAASSRAIPIEKMIEAIEYNPAWPEQWGSNQPGMQAGDLLTPEEAEECKVGLQQLKSMALDEVRVSSSIGLHKQVANRYLEPWAHITVIATAESVGIANFFALRAHPMAQPEFQVLAYRMLYAYLTNSPKCLPWGAWHIPYQTIQKAIYEGSIDANSDIIKQAVGRIARVSYNRQEVDDEAKNIQLHDKLAESGHWSPFEHVAQAWGSYVHKSNFDTGMNDEISGWRQYRKSFRSEIKNPDLVQIMSTKPEWVKV